VKVTKKKSKRLHENCGIQQRERENLLSIRSLTKGEKKQSQKKITARVLRPVIGELSQVTKQMVGVLLISGEVLV